VRTAEGDLPFVDEHRTTIEAPLEVVWRGLRKYVDRMIAANDGGLFTKLLGAQPPAGFEVSEEVPEERLALTGRHRFSRYALVFELDPSGSQTVLRALTYAVFPGPHGRVYRLLVISSRVHVVATRRLLASIRRACLDPGAV
jgi:hypothetical protein